MIRHLVLWTLKPEKKSDAAGIAATLSEKFHALLGVVDGLKTIELGRNDNGGEYDLILNCTFDSKKAAEAYQTHPAHVAVKEIVHTLISARASADYEI